MFNISHYCSLLSGFQFHTVLFTNSNNFITELRHKGIKRKRTFKKISSDKHFALFLPLLGLKTRCNFMWVLVFQVFPKTNFKTNFKMTSYHASVVLKSFSVSIFPLTISGLLLGSNISRKFAAFLEENELFVPDDDDVDWEEKILQYGFFISKIQFKISNISWLQSLTTAISESDTSSQSSEEFLTFLNL